MWIFNLNFVVVAALISAAHFDVAHAQTSPKRDRAAMSCGRQLTKLCSGMAVAPGGPLLTCLRAAETKLSKRCGDLAKNVERECDRDANQYCPNIVAGAGNIIDCLRATRVVSPQCNEALDAVFARR